MKIKAILEKKGSDVYSISPDQTLADMVNEMIARHIGSLLVVNDDGSLAGIVTERDLLRNVAKLGENWESAKISEIMTRDLITTTSDETLDVVMEKMSENRIRHIPVLDADGVTGLLSVVDIIRALHEETSYQNTLLKRYIQDWPEKEEA